ncbi:hypothetical protein [Rhodoblastus sp.]|uniref:hypothetical protein n=1 Tax=Rhodoblastus sp. TaxID=1962975 RepID=UPI003F9714E9
MTTFETSKHFEVPVKKRYGRLTLDGSPGRKFWKQDGASDYKLKKGCYIFGIKHGNNFVATYIGKATKTFKQEIFQRHKKEEHYIPALHERKTGQAIIIFIAHIYVNKPNISSIDSMETQLIQQAVRKKLALTNLRKTYIKELKIHGVFDFRLGKKPRGKSDGAAKILLKMLKF